MRLRSLLFVPGDRPERFAKAAASGADAVILDLEDSVAPPAKQAARAAVADYLAGPRTVPMLVRINPATAQDDLAAVMPLRPDGVVLPKAEGARSVQALLCQMGPAPVPILPIATETPAALFRLGSYGRVSRHLSGLTWGRRICPPPSAPPPRGKRMAAIRRPMRWCDRWPCSPPMPPGCPRLKRCFRPFTTPPDWPPMCSARAVTASTA
jgi:hypothetical protein